MSLTKISPAAVLRRAGEVLRMEAQTVAAQRKSLDKQFLKAVQLIVHCGSRVVVLGVGKSGLIGRKIAATLASTGTPSVFVHPSEGMHGDLGMITPRDVVLALSYSGETDELKRLLPSIRSMQVPLIAVTGKRHSRLGRAATSVIEVRVKREACPYNVTPTTSSTATLALGDALAMSVMAMRGFKPEDFARLHPGGVLGKRLLWTVGDLMHKGKDNPIVQETDSVRKALHVMTQTRTGATSVVNRSGRLVGYFTDGDFRRLAPNDGAILSKLVSDVMTRHPHVLSLDTRVTEAAELLKKYRCDNMPVVNDGGRPVGLLDERDLLSEGLL